MTDIPVLPPAKDVVMTAVAFDQARADELIHKLGQAIAEGPKYRSFDWAAISVVFELNGGESLFGYVYLADGKWSAATPGNFDILDIALDLQQAMRVPAHQPWKKAMVQIVRATGKIGIDFDYSGEKWVPTPADPEGFANRLKPTE